MPHVSPFCPGSSKRPSWSQFAHRFSSEPDCLAAFIALETAEVLAGAKPSALISIPDRQRYCGLNLYRIWHEHGTGVMERTCLSVREMGKGQGFIQLLFYMAEHFTHFLERRDVKVLLNRAGYRAPYSADHALDQLAERFKSTSFPHEVGIFLGYPSKDVAAFLGWIKLPLACQGPWKMFGNPRSSLGLAEIFSSCRRSMAERLASAQSALECIVPSIPPEGSLFLS